MSRADEIRARSDAEIAVAELEDQLISAKEAGEDTEGLKLELREARRAFRELRQVDAVAEPGTIAASTEVQEA